MAATDNMACQHMGAQLLDSQARAVGQPQSLVDVAQQHHNSPNLQREAVRGNSAQAQAVEVFFAGLEAVGGVMLDIIRASVCTCLQTGWLVSGMHGKRKGGDG